MSLLVSFHRAASTEFIEASTWCEGKCRGLDIEFIAEIERCISLASSEPLQSALLCGQAHTFLPADFLRFSRYPVLRLIR